MNAVRYALVHRLFLWPMAWVALALAAGNAHAGIIVGDSVDVGIYAPTINDPCFLCGGVTRLTVEDGDADAIEPYLAGGGWFDVNVDPTLISITFNRDISWQSGDFIGLVISDIDWLDGAVRALPGASLLASDGSGALNALSQLLTTGLSHTASSVALNWQGVAFAAGTRIDIALGVAAAPPAAPISQPIDVIEPQSLWLLLAALILLGWSRFPALPAAVLHQQIDAPAIR